MYTPHGHYVDPPIPGQPEPPIKARCGGPTTCSECMAFELDAYRTFIAPHLDNPEQQKPPPMPAVLTSPAPSQPTPTNTPLAVSIDGLRDWYQRYLELKDAESQIKDKLAEAREMLLTPVHSQPGLTDARKIDLTIDGTPVLQRRVTTQRRIDSKRMKATRPDLYKEWSVESTQESLNIL